MNTKLTYEYVGVLKRPQEVHGLDASMPQHRRPPHLLLVTPCPPRILTHVCHPHCQKRYRAVCGKLDGCGRIFPLGGKPSRTEYRAVQHTPSELCDTVTTVDMWPHMGTRTLAFSVHMLICIMGQPLSCICAPIDAYRFCTAGVLKRPQEVHRLDADTGGLLICAKSRNALCTLSHAFATRAVKKRYRALVRGKLDGCGRISFPISGKPSCTEYLAVQHTPSELCGMVTTVDMWPHTGRTHQLRKHLALIGHPILGDVRYWGLGCSAWDVIGSAEGQHTKIKASELQDEILDGHASQSQEMNILPELRDCGKRQLARCNSAAPAYPENSKSTHGARANSDNGGGIGSGKDCMESGHTEASACCTRGSSGAELGQCSQACDSGNDCSGQAQEKDTPGAASDIEWGPVDRKRCRKLGQGGGAEGERQAAQLAGAVRAAGDRPNSRRLGGTDLDFGTAQTLVTEQSKRSRHRCSSDANATTAKQAEFLETVDVKTATTNGPGCEARDRIVVSESGSEDSGGTKGNGTSKHVRRDEAMAERMCLWKLQCSLVHPRTQEILTVCIDEPDLFARVRKAHYAQTQ